MCTSDQAVAAPVTELVVPGGGARNPVLMRMIAEELPGVPPRPSDDLGLPSDVEETLAIAVPGIPHGPRPARHPPLGHRRPPGHAARRHHPRTVAPAPARTRRTTAAPAAVTEPARTTHRPRPSTEGTEDP